MSGEVFEARQGSLVARQFAVRWHTLARCEVEKAKRVRPMRILSVWHVRCIVALNMRRLPRAMSTSRSSLRFAAAVVLLGSAALAWLMPAAAYACSVVPNWLRGASREVPVDGVLVLHWNCDPTGGPQRACPPQRVLDSLVVLDKTTGEPVHGGITRQGRHEDQAWMLWKPSVPFTAEASYEAAITSSGPSVPSRLAFRAVAGLAFDPQRLAVRAVVETFTEPTGEVSCCPTSCGGPECVSRRELTRPRITVTIDTNVAGADQWLYRASFHTGSDEPVPGELGAFQVAHHVYAGEADKYCYQIDAEHVTTGQKALLTGCDYTRLEGLGERPADLDKNRRFVEWCLEPPAGYEQEWCASQVGRPSPCDVPNHPAWNSPHCAMRRQICGSADAGVSSNTANAVAADATSDASVAATAAMGSGAPSPLTLGAERPVDERAGCNVGDRRLNVGSLLAILLLLGLAGRGARQRPTHRKPEPED